MEWLMTPLNRNRMDGRIDSDSARKIPGFLKHTIQMAQYAATSSASTISYSASASSEENPKPGPGTIMNAKQP